MCPPDASADTGSVSGLPEGTVIGDYRIVRLLGEGGMGFVYEATHEVLGRRAAMKFLRPELTSNENVVTRFLQEAKAVNVISHDNIIDIYDYGEGAGGAVYFVMEYLEGEDLTDLLERERPLAIENTLSIFKQIMRALSAAHAKRIVHRDLKPDNVFLVRREDNPHFVKLLDFGIAKLRGQGEVKGLTRQGTLMGTPQFMSPEQAQGMSVDARSDIFSLGVMLYYAVTGTLPFDGEDITTIITKIVREEPARPRDVVRVGELPDGMEELILRSLNKEPKDRFATIDEMLAALKALETKLGLGTRVDEEVPALAPPRQKHQQPKRSIGKIAAAIAVLAAAAAVAFVVIRNSGDEAEPNGAKTSEQKQKSPKTNTAPGDDSIAALVAAGDIDGAKARARADLIAELGGDPGAHGNAVIALITARTDAVATLLYEALKGPPQGRLDAARALRDMNIPDAAPKIRAALGESGDKLKIALAACLIELGDDSALPILEQALAGDDPGSQMTAAEALAQAGKGDADKVREILTQRYESTPPGRILWRRAAVGLLAMGDDGVKKALRKELALPHAKRAVAAAAALAQAGDETAIGYLSRVSADPEFSERGAAALALARTNHESALEFVGDGLGSGVAGERMVAAAVAATLADHGGRQHAAAIAKLADDDNRLVRSTARAALLAF